MWKDCLDLLGELLYIQADRNQRSEPWKAIIYSFLSSLLEQFVQTSPGMRCANEQPLWVTQDISPLHTSLNNYQRCTVCVAFQREAFLLTHYVILVDYRVTNDENSIIIFSHYLLWLFMTSYVEQNQKHACDP